MRSAASPFRRWRACRTIRPPEKLFPEGLFPRRRHHASRDDCLCGVCRRHHPRHARARNGHGASTIFRLLAPTILVFGMINPTAWLLQSIGLQERSLKIAFVLCPIVICSYLDRNTLRSQRRRTLAYSVAMTLMGGAAHRVVSVWDADRPRRPAFSYRAAVALGGGRCTGGAFRPTFDCRWSIAFGRLMLAGLAMAFAYLTMLLFVMRQKDVYIDLWQSLRTVS